MLKSGVSYTSFNEEGGDVLSNMAFPPQRLHILILILILIARKCGSELDLFSLKKDKMAELGLFLHYSTIWLFWWKRVEVILPI